MGSIYDSGDRYRNDPPTKNNNVKNKPTPFAATLTFKEFVSGGKALFTDEKGIRHWVSKKVFEAMLKNEYLLESNWAAEGVYFRAKWVTKKKGTSYLTRPFEGG